MWIKSMIPLFQIINVKGDIEIFSTFISLDIKGCICYTNSYPKEQIVCFTHLSPEGWNFCGMPSFGEILICEIGVFHVHENIGTGRS